MRASDPSQVWRQPTVDGVETRRDLRHFLSVRDAEKSFQNSSQSSSTVVLTLSTFAADKMLFFVLSVVYKMT